MVIFTHIFNRMQQADFSWRSGSDQIKVHGRSGSRSIEPLAIIALVHGMGEHSGRYRRLAEFFTSHGFAIITYDQPGHGHTEGNRGHINHYNQLLDGVDELLERATLRFRINPFSYTDTAWAEMWL
ncbi:MAG: alpha/beta hydrolase [Bacteroidia bacterium]